MGKTQRIPWRWNPVAVSNDGVDCWWSYVGCVHAIDKRIQRPHRTAPGQAS